MKDELKEIIEYKGNDENFKLYNEMLESPFDFEEIFFDNKRNL